MINPNRKITLRNVRADEAQLKILKSKANVFSVFSSKEMNIIIGYLRPYIIGIILLIALTLGISVLEGMKSVSIIGAIKALFTESIDALGNLKIMGRYEVAPILKAFKDKYALVFFIFGIFVVFSIMSVLTRFFVSMLTRRLQLALMRNLRRDLYNKMMSLSIDFFNETRTGELFFVTNSMVNRFSNLILYSTNMLSSLFTMLVSFMILFYMSAPITIFVFACGVIFLIIHKKIDRNLKIASSEANRYQNIMTQLFQDIIYGVKLIKLGGLEEREKNEYIECHRKFEREDIKMIKIRSLSEAAREGFFIVVIVLFSGVFFYSINKGIMARDSAFVLAYIAVLLRTMPYFSSLQRSSLSVVEVYAPLKMITDILMKPEERKVIPAVGSCRGIESIQNIRLNDLVFSYKEKDEILSSVEATFSKGNIYAIVGFSGGGKSTLLDLMVGIRRPKRGKILFNDIESERIEPKVLNDKVGYVNQEPLIFHDTLKENLIFFNKNVNQEMIDRALEKASIKEFANSLNDGLNTGLGERGLTVSGGERQRIGLARVFLKDTEVLLLDEATNSLDYKTERKIYDNLRKIKKDKIIIIVAHRLSSLVDFDEILVLYNGRVEEKGAHKELLEQKGVYYSLYKLQETKESVK